MFAILRLTITCYLLLLYKNKLFIFLICIRPNEGMVTLLTSGNPVLKLIKAWNVFNLIFSAPQDYGLNDLKIFAKQNLLS